MLIETKNYIGPIKEILQNNFWGCASTESILHDWATNKEWMYKIFGERTIVESEEISLEVEDKREIRTSFLEFNNRIPEFVKDEYMCAALRDFMSYSVGTGGFKDNVVKEGWDSENVALRSLGMIEEGWANPVLEIGKGMRFSRSLRTFFNLEGHDSEEQEPLLKAMQDLYSTYRQGFSSKKKGRVFLSIDPYDYLSLSSNNHNWSSCHNLEDGDYRVGNLNYMADAVTAVGYYCSDNKFDENLYIFDGVKKWNSKRWRVLVHLKEQNGVLTIAYSKQYPFSSDKLLEKLDETIRKTYKHIDFSESKLYDYDDLDESLIHKLMRSGDDTCQYGDFGNGGNYHIRINESFTKSPDTLEKMIIGKAVNCLECGEHVTTRERTGLCDSCSEEFYCEDCDGYYSEGDMEWDEEEGVRVCYSCYEERYRLCEECNEVFHTTNLEYSELRSKEICRDCMDKIRDSEGILIVVLNDVARQEFKGEVSKENSNKFFQLVDKKISILTEREAERGLSVVSVQFLMRKDENYDDRWYTERMRQLEVSSIKYNANIRFNHFNKNPLRSITGWEYELPKLKRVVLFGSTNEKLFKQQIEDLREVLDEMDFKDTKIDYEEVRII